jgi:hypothetical protein
MPAIVITGMHRSGTSLWPRSDARGVQLDLPTNGFPPTYRIRTVILKTGGSSISMTVCSTCGRERGTSRRYSRPTGSTNPISTL